MASSKAKRSATTSRRSGNGKDARSSSSSKWSFLVVSVAILASVLWDTYTRQEAPENDDDKIVVTTVDNSDCGLIMAQSAFPNNAGWGMFALKDVELHDQVGSGEVVIQLTNLLAEYTSDFHVMLENYAWEAHNGAGSMEASSVYSLLPGAGSLANGHPSLSNMRARLPEVTHSGVTRKQSPGAGASSHYQNLRWIASKPIKAGDEVIMYYGSTWFKKMTFGNPDKQPQRTVKDLRDTGMCLDNIRPEISTIRHAGRGAFATRNIPKGHVIAPAPLIVIPRREALTTRRDVQDPAKPWKLHQVVSQQLLLNYCFGHSKSSLLFCPYGPVANLINHASKDNANAKVQWSQSEHLFAANRGMLEWPLDMIQSHKRTGLLMEIFATRDIKEGEEVFLNYGDAWEKAWQEHVANWEPNDNDNYQYPFEVDMTDPLTVDYAENAQMSCFYASKRGGETTTSSSTFADRTDDDEMVVQWEQPPTGTVIKRVQPCHMIGRDDSSGLYTAKLLEDSIVVTHMPHSAIVLKDKPHTSDQHLENAFRHEIGIPNHIFPKQWMDLA